MLPSEGDLRVLLAPSSDGPRDWTLPIRTADPARPLIRLHITTTAAPTTQCQAPLLASPSGLIGVAPPWPQTLRVDLTNPNPTDCLVTVDFDVPPPWPVSAHSFFVDAGATFPFELTVTEPASTQLRFEPYGAPNTVLSINAQ